MFVRVFRVDRVFKAGRVFRGQKHEYTPFGHCVHGYFAP